MIFRCQECKHAGHWPEVKDMTCPMCEGRVSWLSLEDAIAETLTLVYELKKEVSSDKGGE